MPGAGPVSFSVEAGAALITLSDSANGNVLNPAGMSVLLGHLRAAAADPAVRAVLLRSDGPVFCHGMDFSVLLASGQDSSAAEKAVGLYVDLLTAVHACPKPVVCILKGDVKAGGVGLVSACDAILASDQATFELSEVFFGLIPANVIPFLMSLRLAPQKVRYLVLTAKKVSAAEALRLGLADEVFPEADLEKGVRGVMKNLFRASPAAMADLKKFTAELAGDSLGRASNLARRTLLEMIKRPEVLEAIRAFREGGTPGWFSRFKPENPVT